MNRPRLLLALGAALTAALLATAPGLAHALLVRSVPESDAELLSPPASIEMWFSEPLEAAFSNARLVGPAGEEVETGAVIVASDDPTHMTVALGQLEPGLYTVAWQTLSQVDGHEWFGSFPFTVLNPDGSRPAAGQSIEVSGDRGDLPSAGEATARWLALVPAMLTFGGTAVQLAVMRDGNPLTRRAQSNLAGVIWLAAAAVVLGTVLQLTLQALRLGGISALAQLTLHTRTGLLGLVRIVLVTVLGLAATELQRENPAARPLRVILPLASFLFLVPLAASESPSLAALWLAAAVLTLAPLAIFRRPDPTVRAQQALLIGSIALLLTFSTSSHAGAVQGSLFAVAADSLHLLAAAFWFSGIALLSLLWLQVRRAGRRSDFLLAVKRFSALAGAAVYVIALTGVFSGLVELPTLPSLWETPYGQVLLVKLTLVAAAWSVAFVNNRRVRQEQAVERLPRSIAVESGLALGVLVVVAFLVQTPTPRSLAAESEAPSLRLPFNVINRADELNVHVQVNPNQAGENYFWVHLYHDDASDVGEVQLVRLFFEHQQRKLGRSSTDLEPLGQDTFAIEGGYLSQPGLWQLEIYVRRHGLDDILSTVRLEVPPASTAQAASPVSNPVPGLPPLALVGGLSIVLGATPFLWPSLLEERFPRAFPATGALLIAFGIFGLARGFFSVQASEVPLIQRSNPIPPTAESIARGQEIYQQSCVICHGVTGRGDGPVGVTLAPRPSDFVIHMPPGIHSDGQLLEWISNGFPNSAMPAFGESHSEEDLWHVINYIRTFAPAQVGDQ